MNPKHFHMSLVSSRSGLTIVESVVAMVIVSGMLVGALTMVGSARKGELANTDACKAQSFAQDLLTEIMAQPYSDAADSPTVFGPTASESVPGNRSLFNDVNDYRNWSETPPRSKAGTALSADSTWTRTVRIDFLDPTDVRSIVAKDQDLARITVEVSHNGALRASLVSLRSAGLPATQSCALPGGTCVNLAPAHCISRGGTPGGANTNCWTFDETTGASAHSGLVSVWMMNDASGTRASDSAGSNDAILTNGPTWGVGKFDGALVLDGNNDYASVTHNDNLSLNDTFTLAAWVYFDAVPGSASQVVIYKGGTLILLSEWNYILSVTNGKVQFDFVDTKGGRQSFNSGTISTSRTWHHIAASFDRSAGQVCIFLNGTLVKSVSTAKIPKVNTNDLRIGADPFGANLKGRLDDVRIYNRVLSSSDISTLYNGGEP